MSDNIDPRKKFARQKQSCAGLTYEQKKHRPDCMDEVNRQFVMKPQRIKPKPPTPVPPGPVPPGPVPPGPRPGPNIPSLPPATDPFSAIAYSGRRQLGTNNVNPGVIIGATMGGAGALAMAASGMFAPATAPSGAYRPLPIDEPYEPGSEEFPESSAGDVETGDVETGLRTRSGFQFEEGGEPQPEGVEMQEPSYMDGIRARLSGRPSGYQQVPTEEPETAEPSAPQPGGEVEMTGSEPPGTMQEVPLDEPSAPSGEIRQPPTLSEPSDDLDLDDLMSEAREEAQQVQQASQSAQSAEEGTQVSEQVEQAEAQIGEGADIDPADMPSGSYTSGIQEASGQGDFDEDDAEEGAEEGAEDVAEEGAEETGLEEAAGEVELAGGGPENPIADIASIGLLLAGAGLAIAGAVAQSEQSKGAPSAVGMPKSSNATILTGSAYTNFVNGLNKQINKASGSTKAQLQAQLSQVESAKQNNRQITVYQADGQPQVAVQMNKTQLAQAILSYQRNPNIFAGVSATRLQAMGLNPKMSLGTRAGHTSNGIPYPVSASNVAKSGKNVYLNTAISGTPFNKQSDIENQAFSGGGASLHDTYVQNAQSVINKQTNPQVKAYLTYQLQTYQYQNGMIDNKPKTVPQPTGTSASDVQSAETAEANARRQLQQTQAAIAAAKLKQSQTNLVNTQTANINARTSGLMSTFDTQQTNINNQITRVQGMISSYKSANPGKPVPSTLTDALNRMQTDNTNLAAQRQQVQANAAKQIADVKSIVVPPSNQNAAVSTQNLKVLPAVKPVVAVQNKTLVAPRAPAPSAQRPSAPSAPAPSAPSK